MVPLYYCLTSLEPPLCLAALSIRLCCADSVYVTSVCVCVYECQSPLWCNTLKSLQCVLSDAKCAVLSLYLLFKHGSNRSSCMYRIAFTLTRLCILPSLTGKCVWVSDHQQTFKVVEGELQCRVDWCFQFLLYWYYFNITSQCCSQCNINALN